MEAPDIGRERAKARELRESQWWKRQLAKGRCHYSLVTGWGASLDEEEARRKGVVAVVHKPFEIDELIRTAARLLGT